MHLNVNPDQEIAKSNLERFFDKKELLNRQTKVYDIVDEIINTMSEGAIAELFQGGEKDINDVFFTMEEVVYNSLYGALEPRAGAVDSIKQFEHLSGDIEETMRLTDIAYFTQSCIPQFRFSWFHTEWASFASSYHRLCIIAARDTGKSYFWTMAYIAWKMYRYRNPATYRGYMAEELANSHRGILVTNAIGLAKIQLEILKGVIEDSPILSEKLYNNVGKNDWGKERIKCSNGAVLQCYGAAGKIRGEHPGYGVVDDFLNDSSIYSQEQREKYLTTFNGVIVNAVNRGQLIVVGCVTKDTVVQTRNGLRRIGELNTGPQSKEKAVYDMSLDIMGKEGYRESVKYFVNGKVDTKIIETEKGHRIEGSHRHPLWVMGNTGIADWKRSDEIEVGDYVAVRTGTGFGDDRIDEVNDPELAYLLGLWIAEGSREKNGRVTISNTDKEIKDWLLSKPMGLDFKLNKSQDWKIRVSSVDFSKKMDSLGATQTKAPYKRVPRAIMEGTKETVREFLRGAFDGDGCAWTSGRQFGVTYGTASEGLARDIHTLLNHFGIAANVYQRNKVAITERAHGRHKLWIVDMRGQEARQYMRDIGFRLTRKQAKIKPMGPTETPQYSIPNQGELIRAARKEKPRFNKSPNGVVREQPPFSITQASKSKTITPNRLQQIVDYLERHSGKGENIDALKENLSKTDFCWTKVKSIKDGAEYTFDFVIPNDHSFVGNSFIQHNTPFHQDDLYSNLKSKGVFKVFTYPAIYPDGQLLDPKQNSIESIMEKKRMFTSSVFARENLCMPISSDSSIFPNSTIDVATLGMENKTLTANRIAVKEEFRAIIMGCDFAMGSNADSDYSVFTTWGVDKADRMWLLDMYREKNRDYNQQCIDILNIYKRFRHDEIIMETNGFQDIFAQFGRKSELPIVSHNTNGSNKRNMQKGIPGLAMKMQQGRVKLPIGDVRSKLVTDIICEELQGMSWSENKIQGVAKHDDCVMSTWIASTFLDKEIEAGFGFMMI